MVLHVAQKKISDKLYRKESQNLNSKFDSVVMASITLSHIQT